MLRIINLLVAAVLVVVTGVVCTVRHSLSQTPLYISLPISQQAPQPSGTSHSSSQEASQPSSQETPSPSSQPLPKDKQPISRNDPQPSSKEAPAPDPQQLQNVQEKIDKIFIKKGARILEVHAKGKLLKTYRVALGFNPVGPKTTRNDGKTPEGEYRVVLKSAMCPRGYKALLLSYPNDKDKARSKQLKIDPGDNICIHGLNYDQKKEGANHIKKDWTKGCIGVTDAEMDEIFKWTDVGTLVEIVP
ncbi:MAG: L,D-transpeptidase family protein [Holosporales bacterium]|jgi:murein L,D-transpeptidase YafK|nr:L,D-transpeptidase family protein [Holosporales bacterium]